MSPMRTANLFGNFRSRGGLTLIEVVMALALVLLLGLGLYAIGQKARTFTEHLRIASEARVFGKAKMEELAAYGTTALSQSNFLGLAVITNQSSRGYSIVISPRVFWHSADGGIVPAANADYAEVQVAISYFSPFTRQWREDHLTSILEKERTGGPGP